MIIRGVFSMSIINRLKSLLKEENNENDINNDVSSTSDDVNASYSEKVTASVSHGNKEISVTKEKTVTESGERKVDLTFKKDIKNIDNEVEETPIEVSQTDNDSSEEIVEKVEVAEEETPVETETAEDDEVLEDVEKVDENIKNKNTERDNMTLLTDKELLNDSNRDPDSAEFIDAGIETVKHCFQCGTCSGGCPSGRRTPYKVRQIVRKCLLGLKEEVITDDALWMCTTCYTCQERCPRSVKIVEIIKKARNVAAHAGYMAKPHKMTGLNVIKTGHGVPINDAAKSLRVKIGLPEVPPTTHAYPEALEEVQKLCKITAFDDLIGYDEATGGLKE